MVGIFSRFGVGKTAAHHQHSRSPSTSEEEPKATSLNASEETIAPLESSHGVGPMEEFIPVEHPKEPTDNDQPVRCPPLEPCIIHDGRIWKERLQLTMKQRGELPFVRDSGTPLRQRSSPSSEHLIQPSTSAPEKSL